MGGPPSRGMIEEELRPIPAKDWAEMIRNVYAVDPLICPQCGPPMKVIAFLTDDAVVDRITNHLKLTFGAERPPVQALVDIFFGQLLYSLAMVGGDNKREYATAQSSRAAQSLFHGGLPGSQGLTITSQDLQTFLFGRFIQIPTENRRKNDHCSIGKTERISPDL